MDYQRLLAQHQYAIIRWNRLTREQWHAVLPVRPLVPAMLRSDEEKLPVLLALHPDAPYMAALRERLEAEDSPNPATRPPGGRLLSCLLGVLPGLSPTILAFHLTEKTLLSGPGGMKLLFAYHSPFVFPQTLLQAGTEKEEERKTP